MMGCRGRTGDEIVWVVGHDVSAGLCPQARAGEGLVVVVEKVGIAG